jgi:hypothetical protein
MGICSLLSKQEGSVMRTAKDLKKSIGSTEGELVALLESAANLKKYIVLVHDEGQQAALHKAIGSVFRLKLQALGYKVEYSPASTSAVSSTQVKRFPACYMISWF